MQRSPATRRAVAWAALCFLGLSACGLGHTFWASYRHRATVRNAVAAGRYAEARRRLETWLKSDPESAEAHYLKARIALGTDRLDDLAAGLKQAEVLGYPRGELGVLKAIIAVKQGRHADAEAILRQAFDAGRARDRLVDEALAKVYVETYNLALAEPVIERWTRDAPEDPKPYLWRVEIDRRKGDVDALIRDYREALKRDPSRDEARLALADELRAAHRCAEAAVDYSRYVARKPKDPDGHYGLGRNSLELGDENAALRHFERALQLDPKHAQAHRVYGEIALRRGNVADALDHFDRAVETDPDDIKSRSGRALALSQLGRGDQAKAEREAVQRLRDDQLEVERFRLRLLNNPRDADLQCQAARWMFKHAHVREGVRWAEEALRNRPGFAEVSNLLADYYQSIGNSGLANFYRVQTAN